MRDLKKRRGDNLNQKKKTVEYGKYGYIFLAPFFLVFAVFQLYPIFYTFYQSVMYEAKNGRYSTTEFGFGNFTNYIFGEAGGGEFWHALCITIVLWVLNFIPQIVLSLVLAAWFTDVKYKLKGNGIYKVIMYMPNIITAATIAVLFYSLFNTNGSITLFLKKIGIMPSITDPFGKGWFTLILIAFIQFWMWYGNTMIVLCAGILGINPALYEAAMVDGASSTQMFFKITIPLLKPILQYTLVTSAIGGLQMYDIPALLNEGTPIIKVGGTPIKSTTTVLMLIRDYVSPGTLQNYGRAAAYSVVLFIVTLAISMFFYKVTSEKPIDGR